MIQDVPTANAAPQRPIVINAGALLVNVEKVDLSASNCRLDFYRWFNYNPSEINQSEVEQFEFVNGAPTLYVVDANEAQGYLEYRVRGDFINSFDFSRYPFESHQLEAKIEHKNHAQLLLTTQSLPQKVRDALRQKLCYLPPEKKLLFSPNASSCQQLISDQLKQLINQEARI
jgi:hypothetical protein